ncbi:MAG: hypothetical protein GC192_24510 [Bacteroidetes bacterium]|nr:hypothetical protein [Bacteroidota bacterium]
MKNWIQFPSLSICIVILLSSCFTPRSIIRMDAKEAENVKWSYGKELTIQQMDSLQTQIYFDTYNKSDLVFDVEVTNYRSEPVLLSPEKIYLKCAESEFIHPSIDPEKILLKEEIDISRREAAAKNTAVIVGVATVATVVAVAVADKGGNGSNNDNNSNNFYSNNIIISNYVAPPLAAPVMPPSLDFWANYSLRKTTLDQNYKVGGKVVIPRMDSCPNLEVYMPVGDEIFKAGFIQTVIQP